MSSYAFTLAGALLLGATAASAAERSVAMSRVTVEGIGPSVGTVTLSTTEAGTTFLLGLEGLPPGQHGFHIHANGDCGPGPDSQGRVVAAGAAGGHWDPGNTGKHAGPEGDGHLGDLPAITVAADGTATGTVTAPRISDAAAIEGLALMIHSGGDNHSDHPAPLGGGGARIACGVIE
jgi:Cu-Zn family superoxide dismutase